MTDTRPNIVFVITDQQRHDTIRAMGFPYMDTPNLDALVEEGTAFSNMYVTSPCCAPSRASLFTGLYPHNSGVLRNDEVWPSTWVSDLAAAGYHCCNVGKMHTHPFEAPFGFHERHVVENKDRAHPNLPFFLDNWDKALMARGVEKPDRRTYRRRQDYATALGAFSWELDRDLHPDVFTGRLACCWLKEWNGTKPFFLQVGLPGPHPPYDPAPEDLEPYLDRDLPAPIPSDIEAQPKALQELQANHIRDDHDAVRHLAHPTEEQTRRQRAHYYANVSMIDGIMGEIRAALDERGVADNTIIIFTSDHGDCLNDHGHSQKWTMYEHSVRVPAIIHDPRHPGGARVDDLVSLMDLGPTVLEFAGLVPPSWMEGLSLAPYIRGETGAPLRTEVFAELARDMIQSNAAFFTMIRTGPWKLVHISGTTEGQLFNLKNDPDECANLWDDANHADTRRELTARLLEWRIESGLAAQGWLGRVAC
ncbi:sulfatase family protein [Martelella sp. AMO21009]